MWFRKKTNSTTELQEESSTHSLSILNRAAVQGKASFDMLAECYYATETDLLNINETTKEEYKKLYPKIVKAFEKSHGVVSKRYFCQKLFSGVVLTENGYVHAVLQQTHANELQEILEESLEKARDVYRILFKKDKIRCNGIYYDIIASLIGYFDGLQNADPKLFCESEESQVLELSRKSKLYADKDFSRSAKRAASVLYFLGMIGVAPILSFIIFYFFEIHDMIISSQSMLVFNILPFTLLSGAVGACISVMTRMSNNTLSLDIHAGAPLLILLGSFRLLIGAILGCVICILVYIGPIKLEMPNEPYEIILFFIGLSFLSGFAERWAQDMLVSASTHVTTQQKIETLE